MSFVYTQSDTYQLVGGLKYVRSTRFATISSGTSGSIILPSNSEVVLDDFGGTTDAIISGIEGGKPTYKPVYDALGNVVATTFDSDGNWVLSSIPVSYPVALIYRVQQHDKNFDSTSSNVIGGASSVVLWGQVEGKRLILNARTVTTSGNINPTDYYVGCNALSSISVTLPDLSTCEDGQCFVIKDEGGRPGVIVTVNTSNGAYIDGGSMFQLSDRESIEIISRGSFWSIK